GRIYLSLEKGSVVPVDAAPDNPANQMSRCWRKVRVDNIYIPKIPKIITRAVTKNHTAIQDKGH
ncbi:MAG: hypothetical protein NDP12_02650, partial [Crenarchaeota archaeon]|nr:hypothetical protein [Thermoproteota archaeon]